MRDRAWLDAVRDRVLADIAANPSQRPYLTEIYAELPTKSGPKPADEATLEARRQRRAETKRQWRERQAEGR
jgi:hypothetical protein